MAMTCPHCRKLMQEAIRCPYCGKKIYKEMTMRDRLNADPELKFGLTMLWRQLIFMVGIVWGGGILCSMLLQFWVAR